VTSWKEARLKGKAEASKLKEAAKVEQDQKKKD
jgi:hypothetical protein